MGPLVFESVQLGGFTFNSCPQPADDACSTELSIDAVASARDLALSIHPSIEHVVAHRRVDSTRQRNRAAGCVRRQRLIKLEERPSSMPGNQSNGWKGGHPAQRTGIVKFRSWTRRTTIPVRVREPRIPGLVACIRARINAKKNNQFRLVSTRHESGRQIKSRSR